MARLGFARAALFALLVPLVGCGAALPQRDITDPAAASASAITAPPSEHSGAEQRVDTLPPDFDVSAMALPEAEPDAATEPAAPEVVAPAAPRFREPVVPRAATRVVVLEYHALGDLDDPGFLTAAAFAEQVRWLEDNHVEIIRLHDLTAWLDGEIELPAVAAVITLDDAHTSARKVALPILARSGAPFTLALNTAAIEEHRAFAMSWDDVREVMKSGLCEIASHSHIHGFMAKMTDASNRRELELSREIIEQRTGVHATAFVFPFGSLNERLVNLTRAAGYDVAFAAWGPTVAPTSPRFRLGRFAVTRDMDLAAFTRPFRDAARTSQAQAHAVIASR